MKKKLLILTSLAFTFSAFAQLESDGQGLLSDNTNGNSNCFVNSAQGAYEGAAGTGGVLVHGSSFVKQAYMTEQVADNGIELQVKDTSGNGVVWFPFSAVDTAIDQCVATHNNGKFIDLSTNAKLQIVASASVANSSIDFFLGYVAAGSFFPASSTFNTGSGASAIVTLEFEDADVEKTFDHDYLASLDVTTWEEWDKNDSIVAFGFRSSSNSAKFNIKSIAVGSAVSDAVGFDETSELQNVKVYPNPAVDNLTIELGEAQDASVELIDFTGKVVASQSNATNFVKINTSNITTGLYIVNINSAQGVYTSKVIVK